MRSVWSTENQTNVRRGWFLVVVVNLEQGSLPFYPGCVVKHYPDVGDHFSHHTLLLCSKTPLQSGWWNLINSVCLLLAADTKGPHGGPRVSACKPKQQRCLVVFTESLHTVLSQRSFSHNTHYFNYTQCSHVCICLLPSEDEQLRCKLSLLRCEEFNNCWEVSLKHRTIQATKGASRIV